MTDLAVYGISSEVFQLVSSLDFDHVTFIDETLKIPTKIERNRMPNNLEQFLRHDISDIASFSDSIGNATVVLFAPKVKRWGEDARGNMLSHVKEVAKLLKRGQYLVNMAPSEYGLNQEIIRLVEALSGLRDGETINYAYAPIATEGKLEPYAGTAGGRVHDMLGITTSFGLNEAELMHFSSVIEKFTPKFLRASFPNLEGEYFIDELVRGTCDLNLIDRSFPRGSAIIMVAVSFLKAIDAFLDELLITVKRKAMELGYRTKNTNIKLLWDVDEYGLRGEGPYWKDAALQRLSESFARVDWLSYSDLKNVLVNSGIRKDDILVACDRPTEEFLRKRGAGGNIIIAKTSAKTY
ncbi:MAG: hypothetical protein JRN22_00570 [Nitrososphaerota archaeon]|nr:hypothetical protein [Nitrososphaerota archaeon]